MRVHSVGEPGLNAGALIQEWQGTDVVRQVVQQARAVLPRLRLNASEAVTLGLGLDHARSSAVHIEQVVGGAVARPERKLPHRHAAGGTHVQSSDVLHHPASLLQQPVDIDSGALFRGRVYHRFLT